MKKVKNTILNPYITEASDFVMTSFSVNEDLCDSSGYLTLADQISIITNQSEINAEFRRGMIDNFNNNKMRLIEELSSFEDNDFVSEQLLKARSGDLLDHEEILNNAYNAGYSSGFYPHQRSNSEAGGTPTHSADDVEDVKTDDKVD